MASVAVSLRISSGDLILDEESLHELARALEPYMSPHQGPRAVSPYMTTEEAAEYLRCDRQRVYDLLSQRRLTRIKEGSRTLVSRAELEQYLAASAPRSLSATRKHRDRASDR
jgi:excisionase family DNA binding protein